MSEKDKEPKILVIEPGQGLLPAILAAGTKEVKTISHIGYSNAGVTAAILEVIRENRKTINEIIEESKSTPIKNYKVPEIESGLLTKDGQQLRRERRALKRGRNGRN